MIAGKTKREFGKALELAQEMARILEPYCERIAIAGSVRRRKPECGDCEIVAIPGDNLWRMVGALVAEGLATRGHVWGQKYKSLVYKGMGFDVFTATADNWGWQYMLRTGSADANKMIASVRAQWSAPFRFADGNVVRVADDAILQIADEDAMYRLLGIPYISPAERGGDTVKRLFEKSWAGWGDVWSLKEVKQVEQMELGAVPVIERTKRTEQYCPEWRWLDAPVVHYDRAGKQSGEAIVAYYGDMPYTMRSLRRRMARGAYVPPEFEKGIK